MAKSIIFKNLNKPLSFHIDNLKNNGLHLSINQVKRLLQNIRDTKYPTDDAYLKDISKIKITFEKTENLENLNLCQRYTHIINPDKNNKLEKYIIFITCFQIKLLKKCSQILINGTFKSCPKKFYQIINFAGFYEEINGIIPIFMILATGKSEYIYNSIFSDLKKIIIDFGIKIEDIPFRVMCDFEKSLQKSIKQNFPNSIVDGCFFHFVKLLWSKAKSFGLCKKKYIKNTKIILFILKMIPFIKIDDRVNLFEKMEEYFSSENMRYKNLLSYYKKNWLEILIIAI